MKNIETYSFEFKVKPKNVWDNSLVHVFSLILNYEFELNYKNYIDVKLKKKSNFKIIMALTK